MADKMLRVAGRGLDGLAKALSVETDDNGHGVLRVVDAAPVASYQYEYDEIALAESLAIRVSGSQFFTVENLNGRNITLVITSSLDVACTIRLSPFQGAATYPFIYNETGALESGNGVLVIGSEGGGTGVGTRYKSVPALKNVMKRLTLAVIPTSAPTSGTITITAYVSGR